MFHTRHLSTVLKGLLLALLTLACASSASASGCMAQGQSFFQSCIENFAADGTVTAFEEGICSRGAADVVTECERQGKPGFPALSDCYLAYSYTIFWDNYPGEFTVVVTFTGPLVCS